MITIVLPVYNEELILKDNTLKVFNFCQKNIKSNWQIVISDNASTDKTQTIGQELANQHPQIKYFRIQDQGKGYGVIQAWQNFESHIYIFMDADLSTDLKSLPELIRQIDNGYHIAAGSRYIKGAQVDRSLFRKSFSLALRMILKLLFNLKVKDAPCGFKAVNQQVINQILPNIQNKTWFFDTEMLILAQRGGLKIKEIPVRWQESTHKQRQSKVGIIKVIKDYLKNIYSIYVRH